MSTKKPLLMMLALTTTIGCAGEVPKANAPDEGDDSSQEGPGSDESGEDEVEAGDEGTFLFDEVEII